MKVLRYDNILKSLDLPTVGWKPYYSDTEFAPNLLWSIKAEEIPQEDGRKKSEPVRVPFLTRLFRSKAKPAKVKGIIGADADTAKIFAKKLQRQIDPSKQRILYYPYYTVVKSGILDISRGRIVIEGTKGEISNLTVHNHVSVTMIFTEDDLKITGEEKFFTQEEVLPLIDYGKEIRKRTAQDMELDKNIQLYFSYVYKTSVLLKPEGELQLIFYKFKFF